MKELKDYSDIELKALKADMYEQIQAGQQNLQVINSELQRRASLPKEAPKEEVKKK